MTKEQKQLIIVGFLIIILVFAVINSIASVKKTKKPAAAAPAAGESPVPGNVPVSASGAEGVSSEAKTASSNEKWGRDPFGDLEGEKDVVTFDFKLMGISYARGEGYANINNEIMKKGDRLGDYEIAEIYKDKVLLKKGDQELYLTFPEN